MLPFKAGTAFVAGIIGGVAMTIMLFFARLIGMTPMNLAMVLGAMFTGVPGVGTWILGFIMHLIISGLIALVYAAIFRAWNGAGWVRGVVISLPHALVTGLFFVILPAIHPAVPEHEAFAAPGFMGVNFGVGTVIGVILLHMIYGAVVGAVYRARVAYLPV